MHYCRGEDCIYKLQHKHYDVSTCLAIFSFVDNDGHRSREKRLFTFCILYLQTNHTLTIQVDNIIRVRV